MIRVLISVKIYVLLVIYPFLLPGRLLTSFKPVLRPDPLIQTWLGKKMPFYGHPDKFLKSEGRRGYVQTNLAEASGQKPNFRDQAFSAIAWGPQTTSMWPFYTHIVMSRLGLAGSRLGSGT